MFARVYQLASSTAELLRDRELRQYATVHADKCEVALLLSLSSSSVCCSKAETLVSAEASKGVDNVQQGDICDRHPE